MKEKGLQIDRCRRVHLIDDHDDVGCAGVLDEGEHLLCGGQLRQGEVMSDPMRQLFIHEASVILMD